MSSSSRHTRKKRPRVHWSTLHREVQALVRKHKEHAVQVRASIAGGRPRGMTCHAMPVSFPYASSSMHFYATLTSPPFRCSTASQERAALRSLRPLYRQQIVAVNQLRAMVQWVSHLQSSFLAPYLPYSPSVAALVAASVASPGAAPSLSPSNAASSAMMLAQLLATHCPARERIDWEDPYPVFGPLPPPVAFSCASSSSSSSSLSSSSLYLGNSSSSSPPPTQQQYTSAYAASAAVLARYRSFLAAVFADPKCLAYAACAAGPGPGPPPPATAEKVFIRLEIV